MRGLENQTRSIWPFLRFCSNLNTGNVPWFSRERKWMDIKIFFFLLKRQIRGALRFHRIWDENVKSKKIINKHIFLYGHIKRFQEFQNLSWWIFFQEIFLPFKGYGLSFATWLELWKLWSENILTAYIVYICIYMATLWKLDADAVLVFRKLPAPVGVSLFLDCTWSWSEKLCMYQQKLDDELLKLQSWS